MVYKSLRLYALIAALALLFAAVGCGKLEARDQLNKGVQAFKDGKYEDSIEHFKNAAHMDPDLVTARMYLGVAYMQLYTPDNSSPDNQRYAQLAIDEFNAVLKTNPGKDQQLNALKRIASLYSTMGNVELAKQYYRQAAAVDPNDAEIDYSLGQIDWTQSYHAAAEAKAKIGLKVDDPYTNSKQDQKVCQAVKAAEEPVVDDGIQYDDKALQLRPDYEDAMAFVNLLYRRKADLQCGNPAARQADLKLADQWTDKTMATRKAKAERAVAASGITLEQQGK